jgi:hypothetical protein
MLADPNENPLEWAHWWRRRDARVLVIGEPIKLLLYSIVLPFERVFDRNSRARQGPKFS